MKRRHKLLVVPALILFTISSILVSNESKAQTDDGITCGETVCVVDEAKNRFLARGCKSKPDFDCVVGGPGLPDIPIGVF
tara:strand:- start:10794 stop:11033 length:240 start_codon:yes stop_codon:yes gene_type:complete